MALALLGVGIFLGSVGLAYADGHEALEAVDAKIESFITVVAAALVFFMQAGFAFLGAGLIRSKNTINYMTKSFLDFCIASLGFWAFGFALMMGGGAMAGFIGLEGFFLADFDDGELVGWFFQMVFAGTAATIIAGAMAERTKINAYFAYSFLVGAVVYPIYGHWAWSGSGWLTSGGALFGEGGALSIEFEEATIGLADYAGSAVVHMIGGFLALAGAMVVGPRKGFREGADLKGHNIPYVVIGTFILFFGWFGFNVNSGSLGLNAVNTLLAGAAGSVAALYIMLLRTGKADIEMACNGALAGLVGITAGCAYVDPWASVVIGAIAGGVMIGGVWLVKNVIKADDPVGAVAVHGISGAWGVLAVGIFAAGNNGVSGLIAGNPAQLLPQIVGILVAIAWGFGVGFIMFKLIDVTMGLRASDEEEEEGLDEPEHGASAYPELANPA